MFNRCELFKQIDTVGTLLTYNEIQFLGFLFTHLLPTVSSSLILCVAPTVRARIFCLLARRVPVHMRPISNNVIDMARLLTTLCGLWKALNPFLCYR